MHNRRSVARWLLFLLATCVSNAFTPTILPRRSFSSRSMSSMVDAMSEAISKSLGRTIHLKPASGGGFSGGGGASTSAVVDPETNTKYFVKSARGGHDMLKAEYLGVKEMSETQTIKVPKPIAFGDGPGNAAFVIFEYLDFCGVGSGKELGVQLAMMHRCVSENGKFGFHVDSTIGATPQPNLPWIDDWGEFWDKHRLGHMLKLTNNAGLSDKEVEQLRTKTRQLLSHEPQPSLLHGDLWGGNKSYAKVDGKVVPVIFDPATYYGDREADVAMTFLFGGFGADFYEGYESEWPLPEVRT
jgi:fructosamine-3-kinase